MSEPAVVAFVDDMMDRSRISSVVPEVRFQRRANATVPGSHADIVVVDLARYSDDVATIRAAYASARIVGFAPHADEILRAEPDPALDRVLPRSRFFHDIRAALGYS